MGEIIRYITECPHCGAKAKSKDEETAKSKLKMHIQHNHPEKAV